MPHDGKRAANMYSELVSPWTHVSQVAALNNSTDVVLAVSM